MPLLNIIGVVWKTIGEVIRVQLIFKGYCMAKRQIPGMEKDRSDLCIKVTDEICDLLQEKRIFKTEVIYMFANMLTNALVCISKEVPKKERLTKIEMVLDQIKTSVMNELGIKK